MSKQGEKCYFCFDGVWVLVENSLLKRSYICSNPTCGLRFQEDSALSTVGKYVGFGATCILYPPLLEHIILHAVLEELKTDSKRQ